MRSLQGVVPQSCVPRPLLAESTTGSIPDAVRWITLLCALCVACLLVSAFPAWGQGNHGDRAQKQAWAEARAQEVIDACWALSLEDRSSGVTARMRRGALESSQCMRKHILFLSENVLFSKSPDTQRRVKESLEQVHSGIGGFYWEIYNNHDACDLHCGTMYMIFHNNEVAKTMERILKDSYMHINQYKECYDPVPEDANLLTREMFRTTGD
jgi:hypothetical protein